LPVDDDAAVAKCAYCGTSVRLQRRTKLIQRPIKLPPPQPEEPVRVARAAREWTASSITANACIVLVGVALLAIFGLMLRQEWRGHFSLRWDDDAQPRFCDCDGDGVDDVVGIVTLSDELEIAAVSGKTGDAIWHVALDDKKHRPRKLAIVGDTIVVSDLRGTVFGFDPRTGARRWKNDLGDQAGDLCPGDRPGTIIVTMRNGGQAHRLELATGALTDYTRTAGFRCDWLAGTYADGAEPAGDHEQALEDKISVSSAMVYRRGNGLRIALGVPKTGRSVPRIGGLRDDGTAVWEHDVGSGDRRDIADNATTWLGISDDAVGVSYQRTDEGRHGSHLVVLDRATGVARYDITAPPGRIGLTNGYVVVSGACLDAYDVRTGKPLWGFGCP
jgi:outer membrane protein assembly factor BamB